jgi:hypothetical protein
MRFSTLALTQRHVRWPVSLTVAVTRYVDNEIAMQVNRTDDFGGEISFVDLGPNALNASIRFQYDGCADAIAEGLMTGESDDESLRFFGLIK